jgi:urease accessory protein
MMRVMKRLLPLLVFSGSALSLSAHPAIFHGAGAGAAASAGFLHPLTGLDHLVVMVAVGLWAVQMGGRALWALPCAFVGSMMIGGVTGLASGIAAPVAEHGIVASIFLLGAALGMAWRPSLLWAILLTSLAGLCHGYAHGSEMPSGLLPLLYFAGMVGATAILHAAGVGAGSLARRAKAPLLLRASGVAVLLFAIYDTLFPVA